MLDFSVGPKSPIIAVEVTSWRFARTSGLTETTPGSKQVVVCRLASTRTHSMFRSRPHPPSSSASRTGSQLFSCPSLQLSLRLVHQTLCAPPDLTAQCCSSTWKTAKVKRAIGSGQHSINLDNPHTFPMKSSGGTWTVSGSPMTERYPSAVEVPDSSARSSRCTRYSTVVSRNPLSAMLPASSAHFSLPRNFPDRQDKGIRRWFHNLATY